MDICVKTKHEEQQKFRHCSFRFVLVNVNQTCFETLTKIVQRIQRDLLSEFNDHHGRNRLLLTYIHYECTLHASTEPGQTEHFFVFSLLIFKIRF